MDLLTLITTFVVAGSGAYFGAYLKKKGENLATHEDIGKLVTQVAAVTQTAKEIEAKISDDLWDKQRKWEIRRDALFEAMKELGTAQVMLGTLLGAYAYPHESEEKKELNLKHAQREYVNALISLERAQMLATVVCKKPIRNAFDEIGATMSLIRNRVTQNVESAYDTLADLKHDTDTLAKMIRDDLGIED